MAKEVKAAAGDRVRIETTDASYEGLLMPEEEGFLVLKLDSGYNIGIAKGNVLSINLIEKKRELQAAKVKIPKKGLPTISILHTGGTIASKVDYATGAVVARFSPEELLAQFPEIWEIANVSSRLVMNIFSEDMRFHHWNILAQEIVKEIKAGARGIVITHGTDTLHYTSAALSFMLQNLPIPVVLVGSQRSSDRPSTDAALNLLSACLFAARADFAGVVVCMHESIEDKSCIVLPATKCRKMHSSRRDAFKAIGTIPWAKVDFSSRKIEFLREDYERRSKREPKLTYINEAVKVGLLKVHPNMSAEEFLAFKGYDGLVIEGTGLGHAPINESDVATKEHSKIAEAISRLVSSGTVVAMASQTIYGRIDLDVYSTGRRLQKLGVIGNHTDMSPETAFVKLAWLLSNYPKDMIEELFQKSIVGEVSERLEKID
ncbi:MAG: Glu-tRNA(Gln) amidotransferase subunit GatD [Candidatus Woesearchaeota archaeon]